MCFDNFKFYIPGIILFLLCFTGLSIAQPVKYDDPRQRLILCMSNMPPAFSKVVKAAKTPNCVYFKTEEIDPQKTGKINKVAFLKIMNQKIPDKNHTGIIILDWEGSDFDTLWSGTPATKSWNRIVKNYTDALIYAKSLRPKAQWGIYNIPPAIYWVKQSPIWKKRMDDSGPIIKQCDILMPTLYDIYPTGAVSYQDDSAFYINTLKKTLEIAVKYKKPVLPFIWHRYSEAIKESSLKSIEPEEFLNQIRLMASVSYKGKKINGVIWWQEDKYFMNIESKHVVEEMGNMAPDSYQNEVFFKYWKLLNTVFQ